MQILAIDTGQSALDALGECLRKLYPCEEVLCFRDPMMAVKHGVLCPPDAIYTAIDMRRMDGFEVARMLKEDNPTLSINFLADDNKHREDAIRIGMNSYTLKPVTVEGLRASAKEIW